ncbi:MAG: helix-turn-helix domain-containing protein [Pseudonocardiaceae bacterium]
MEGTAYEPLSIPVWAWQRDELRAVLRRRDIGGLFRLAQRYGGVSQSQLAVATGLLQGRISEIIKGTRMVTTLEVFERIADGLGMPDEARILLGLAPLHPVGLEHLGPVGRAEVIAVYRSQQEAAVDISAAVRQAREVDILAVRGLGIIGLNHSLLRPAVTGGSPPQVVRALLVDPDSDAAQRRAAEISESLESFASGVLLAVARLRELAEHTTATVEIYLYDMLPTWRVIALDETLFVSAFGQDIEGHTSPMYKISSTAYGGALHRGFRRFVGELQRTARRVM